MTSSPKCTAGRCKRVRAIYDDKYCSECRLERTCKYAGCNTEVEPNSACDSHKCGRASCSEAQTYGGTFCGRHTCGVLACRAEAVKHGYCTEHGQQNRNEGGCAAPRIPDLRRRSGRRDAI